jgi:predicted secreted protein
VAEATLRAVEGLLTQPLHLELEHVERSDAGAAPVVLVHVSLVSNQGVQRLAGSAVVHDDESGAVVRAALDAVNRRVEALVLPVG